MTDSANNTTYVYTWQSDGLLDSKISTVRTDINNDRAPIFGYKNNEIRLQFKKDIVLKQSEADTHKKIVNIYIAYEIN